MTPLLPEVLTAAPLWLVVKASALLALAALVQLVMHRRASAATRHLVWTLAMAGVLLLPVLSFSLPDWPVVTRIDVRQIAGAVPLANRVDEPIALALASTPLPAQPPAAPVAQPPISISWTTIAAGAYAAGVFVLLLHLAFQLWSVRRLSREATDVQDRVWRRLLAESAASVGVTRPVRLARSCERTMPMAFGIRRPTIVIPVTADTWKEDRRRAVLLHELAHVARYDCVTQAVAFIACAAYWFQPATWWVARRLRIERELACDDRALAAGAPARDYAGHLLEIAYAFGGQRAPALAVSMARRGQLEDRMLAVLDATRNRRMPALRVRVAVSVLAAVLLVPLATATSTVVTQPRPEATHASPFATAERQQQPDTVRSLKAVTPSLADWLRRLALAAAATIGIPQEGLPGTWQIRPTGTEGTVHLQLMELHSSSGTNVPIAQLEGLTAAQLTGAGGPVQFRVRRDAGTFTFEGVVRSGVGAGTFSFTPDPNFPAELAKRGFARPTAREQYQMARHDVGFAFIDELSRQGYSKPDTSELVRAGQHGVHFTYLRDMGALGYRLGSLAPLIELRDHGVTPAYIRELSELGYKGLSADDVRRARDHGVSAEYARAMRDAGYGSLPMDELINARDHGVSAQFVRELDEAGYRKLPLDRVIWVRDHGVSAEYVRDMRKLGHTVSIDELVRARDHGVSVEFAREMAAFGYANLSLDSLIRLRDHGVSARYVEELKALGYDRLSIDDLVTLRDHGLSADRIRAANARAGTRLPVDMLKSFAAGGMR